MDKPTVLRHRIPKFDYPFFNNVAHTMRVAQPFVWNHTHLKVHPNGAMIFHEQKRLAFLLPLIVEAHEHTA